MSINQRIEELNIFLERVFSEGVNTEEEKKLIIERFKEDLDILEINKIITKHNNTPVY